MFFDLNCKILTLADSIEWNQHLGKLPRELQDVYYTPEYYSLQEERGEGISYCFVFENNKGLALYPFLMNSVNGLGYALEKEYFDIQGAYGYNGVLATFTDESFLDDFSRVFLSWCERNNVIAEFVRFNPLLSNHLLSNWIVPINILDNVVIPLTTFDDIWLNSFHKKVRKATRKAQRFDLTYISFSGGEISDEFLMCFLEIYNHMLQRNNADECYHYSFDYFHKMKALLPNNTLFAFALYNEIPITTELIIHNSVNAYALFGGTLSDYIDKNPNTYIRNEILKELLDKGLKYYNMGGGISRNDSFYLYKKSFSINTTSVFYIGKKIHNINVYNDVVKQWEQRFPEKIEKYQNRLLKYRE